MMGDMNARVSDKCVGEVAGKWGVPGWNERGERVIPSEHLFPTQYIIHRYTWSRAEQKSLIDYMAMDKSLRRDVNGCKSSERYV